MCCFFLSPQCWKLADFKGEHDEYRHYFAIPVLPRSSEAIKIAVVGFPAYPKRAGTFGTNDGTCERTASLGMTILTTIPNEIKYLASTASGSAGSPVTDLQMVN